MAGWAAVLDGWDDRARRAAFVAGSLALHVAVLAVLGLRVLSLGQPPAAPDRPIYLDIEPRPLRVGEVVRRPPQAMRAEEDAAPPPARAEAAPRLRPEDEAAPAAPVPRLARTAPPGAPPPPADAWRYQPESVGEAVRRTMRTGIPGCSTLEADLTGAEQALCEQRFNEAAARAAPIDGTNNAERDARFAREGRRALQQYEARRRPLSGGVGVIGVQEGPGSNFGTGVAGAHLDPSLRPDSTENIRSRRDGPRAAGPPLTPGASSPRDRQ